MAMKCFCKQLYHRCLTWIQLLLQIYFFPPRAEENTNLRNKKGQEEVSEVSKFSVVYFWKWF